MSDLHVSPLGLNVIRSFEGRALRAYQDEVGVWTIGFGSTNYDKYAVSVIGGPIKKGVEITDAQAEDILQHSLEQQYAPAVRETLPNANQAQFDAGASFHFNTGAIKRATWPKALNQGDMSTCRTSLLSWNKAGGRVLAGLTRRRKRELAMITDGDYGPEGHSGPVQLDEAGRPISLPAKVPPVSTNGATSTGMGMLAKGSKGDEVVELQGWLSELGLFHGKTTGIFDDLTAESVKDFQAAHPNLRKDGIVGPATRSAIIRELDFRNKTKGVRNTVVLSQGGAGTVYATLNHRIAIVLAVSSAFIALLAVVYISWRYRDEIRGIFNRATGRVTT